LRDRVVVKKPGIKPIGGSVSVGCGSIYWNPPEWFPEG